MKETNVLSASGNSGDKEMLTFLQRQERLADQLGKWQGFIDHYYNRYCNDLQSRFDASDLVGQLYMVGHKLLTEGRDPFDDAPLFKCAYVNRIRDIIDHHKAGCRDYHRDLTNFSGAGGDGNDDAAEDPFEQFGAQDVNYQDIQSSDIPIIDLNSDEASPEDMTALREMVARIEASLESPDARILWNAIIDVDVDLFNRWAARKAEARIANKIVRTDGRTPHGLPWQIWADHLGWSVSRVKSCIRDLRITTARLFGHSAIFHSGLSTYASMQLPDDIVIKG